MHNSIELVYNHEEQTFSNYRLIRLLGQGGFAEVYLGEHLHLKTLAALKILKGRLTLKDVKAFLREAQTIAALKHPHIVRILDFGFEDQQPFLIMDYAPNGTLRDRHRLGLRVPLPTIVSYINQIASALAYTHARKLIHRDIKPENMLLDEHNSILLSDFGIVAVAHNTTSMHTLDNSGTITYMAPEQIKGKPCLASDQYALAVVVYEWLCGKRPFTGSSPFEVAMKHLSENPPSLCDQAPDLLPEVEQVVFRALAKDPELRFPSIQKFASALEQASKQGKTNIVGVEISNEQQIAVLDQEPTDIRTEQHTAQPHLSSPSEADADQVQQLPLPAPVSINDPGLPAARFPYWQSGRRKRTVLAAAFSLGSLVCLILACVWLIPGWSGQMSASGQLANKNQVTASSQPQTPDRRSTLIPTATPAPTPTRLLSAKPTAMALSITPTPTTTTSLVTPTSTASHYEPVSYEAESPANVLTGTAGMYPCTQCSGGEYVAYVGTGTTGTTASGTLTFNINTSYSGSHILVIYYVNVDPQRTASMSINSGPSITVVFHKTSDSWGLNSTVGSVNVKVNLVQGHNTILFYNNRVGAPNFDRIVV